jgi:hypothetical protein
MGWLGLLQQGFVSVIRSMRADAVSAYKSPSTDIVERLLRCSKDWIFSLITAIVFPLSGASAAEL